MATALERVARALLGRPLLKHEGLDPMDERIAELLPWHLVRYPHVAAIRAWASETYSPATANKMLAALRSVLREAWLLEQMTAEDFHRAIAVKGVRAVRVHVRSSYTIVGEGEQGGQPMTLDGSGRRQVDQFLADDGRFLGAISADTAEVEVVLTSLGMIVPVNQTVADTLAVIRADSAGMGR